MWRSLDAGTTWESLPPPASLPLFYNIEFVNQTLGWAPMASDWLRTTDGGLHWTASSVGPRPPDSPPVPITFTAADAGVRYSPPFGPQEPRLEQTTDRGHTWTLLSLPSVPKGDAYHVSLTFLDAQRGWVATSTFCIGNHCPLTLHGTNDGGHSWQLLTNQLPRFEAVIAAPILAFGDALHGAALFSGGEHVLLTHDGGRNWFDVPLPVGVQVSGLSYRGSSDIWVVGAQEGHGLLLRSQDAGRTWDVTRFQSVQPYSISFGTPTDGWIAGRLGERNGALLITHDAGRSWSELRPSVSP